MPGMPRHRHRLAVRHVRCNGGFTFAEAPGRETIPVRIVWHADLDPSTLCAEVAPGALGDPDCLIVDRLRPWLTCVSGEIESEHAVLSDGSHHIRLDILSGRLWDNTAVRFNLRFDGLRRAEAGLLPMQRLLALHRHRRFGRTLYPWDASVARGALLLRVQDALACGASARDLADALVGAETARREWPSDSLRSRIKRLIRQAKTMAGGGYRDLMR